MKFYVTNHDLSNWASIINILEELGVPSPDIKIANDQVIRTGDKAKDYIKTHSSIYFIISIIGCQYHYSSYSKELATPYIDIPEDVALQLKLTKP